MRKQMAIYYCKPEYQGTHILKISYKARIHRNTNIHMKSHKATYIQGKASYCTRGTRGHMALSHGITHVL